MIRAQGIDPKTCPAYAKLRLFTSLRRYVALYFVLTAFYVVALHGDAWTLPLWSLTVIIVTWEVAQLALTTALGYLILRSSASSR